MRFKPYTAEQYNRVAAFMDAHLVERKGCHVEVEDVLRMYVQVSGDVHTPYKAFLAVMRKCKGRFVYRNGHSSLYKDHVLSLTPAEPPLAPLNMEEQA